MLLNQTDLYAVRAMAQLALQEPGARVSSRDLSEATGVPNHYLNKIMRKLVEGELVYSQKGHHGGFSLAKSHGDITLFEVLEAIKSPGFSEFCVFGWKQCSGQNPCPLHVSWVSFRDCFLEWAKTTTLQEIYDHNLPLPVKDDGHDPT
ncbi:MAG: Rrf2 family transcriptional regulator [Deltaproteobacteria bacterium]|nr:MAG: Rrf2 family transcriptional regulator [Deltaproteobacteria bacterium]